MSTKIKNIISFKANVVELWGEFNFGNIVSDLKKYAHKGGFDILSAINHIGTFIKDLLKFMLAIVLLLEQVIELAALSYAVMLLTTAMPFAIALLGSILLIATGSYVLIFNESSNILHGFMPAFLKGPAVNHKDSEMAALAKSSVSNICLRLVYLALRLIIVAASFSFLITQLHSISLVAALLANSSAIVPALKLIGVYLAALGAGYAIAELYAKISNSTTSSKESNAMLVAIASLMSMLCAVPLGIYASASFLSVALPLLVVSTGVMRAAFVAAMYVAGDEVKEESSSATEGDCVDSNSINNTVGSPASSSDVKTTGNGITPPVLEPQDSIIAEDDDTCVCI